MLVEPKASRTAVIHPWLLTMGGAERVTEVVCEMVGRPRLFCLVADRSRLSSALNAHSISTSFIQRIPFSRRNYRSLAALFPLAAEQFDLRPYDLVVSCDYSIVKAVITGPEACHICYCFTPMRYAWNMSQEYLSRSDPFKRWATRFVMHYLRVVDYAAAARVDFFAAISLAVRERIRKYYRRDAKLIYPPCDTERFRISGEAGDYYLCVCRLVPYKRVDLAVKAFNASGRRLLVVGDGPERKRLKGLAGPNIQFLGRASEDELPTLYARCRALIFPGEEDFGIVPVEAQASGRPVIAYGRGGALETVVPHETGLFFLEQTPEALNQAVMQFETSVPRFHPERIRQNALRFSKDRFRQQWSAFVEGCVMAHGSERKGYPRPDH
jgi:glycosyltransferase involved in cell wall biosynthesis